MDKDKQQQTIEKYLRDELSAGERERFVEAMEGDPALASEVRLHQMLQQEFGDREKQEFIKELDVLGDRHFNPPPDPGKRGRNWNYWLGGGFLVAIVIAIWLYQSFSTPVPDQPVPEVLTPSAPTEESAPPVVLPEEQPTSTEPEVTPRAAPSAPRRDKPGERPIAQADPADLTPNPYLEALIGSNVRGGAPEFSGIEARFNQKQFVLEGQVKRPAEDTGSLLVFVYSNKEQDFLDGKYLSRFLLDLTPLPAGEPERSATGALLQSARFSLAQSVGWKPGLYYYFIAREDEAEPLYTGKIQLAAN